MCQNRLSRNANHCAMNQPKPCWRLKQIAGPTVEIPPRVSLVIGRGLDSDLMLPDAAVSRRHARLDLGADAMIEDLGGPLGTLVNGQRIDRVQLTAGDLITIGAWQFALSEDTEAGQGHDEITVASLETSLALPRLELLLVFCDRINALEREEQIAACLLETACAGTGFGRAWLLERSAAGLRSLASLPGQADIGEVSRQLLAAAGRERVVCLDHIDRSCASDSVVAGRISAALVARFARQDREHLLYLDARRSEARPQPDAARFCHALVQTAGLAFARLEQERRLWRQREQIYADLHDDLGARLLNLIYSAPSAALADQAREMLVDLRDVVSRPTRDGLALEALLAEMRAEARQRVEAAGALMVWSEPEVDPSIIWNGHAASLLSRCLRELISNALRHAGPSRIRLDWQISDDRLLLALAHDGCLSDPENWQPGRGMGNIRNRCRQLGGRVEWRRGSKLLHARLDLSLEPPT